MRAIAILVAAACASPTLAQLYGVTAGGAVIRIDTTTGAGTFIANSGLESNAAAADSAGHILIGGGSGAAADQIYAIDPITGAGSLFLNTVGRPFGYGIRGMATGPANTLYVVLSSADTSAIDRLASINMTTGVYTVIGPTNRTDIQALAYHPVAGLYGIGIFSGGNLYQLNTSTGAATAIGGGSFAGDDQALEFLPDGSVFACRANLRSINIATGATTLVGATGQTDIRGLAFIAPPSCYADCDHVGGLTGNDFQCFLDAYVAGASYANCDGVGGLTGNDFQCFLNAYVAGCS